MFTDLLKDSCTIRRYTEGAVDDDGHPIKTWADHLTEDCRLTETQAGSGREIYVGAQVVVADYLLYLADVDVTERDRVVVNSITYEILLVQGYADIDSAHHKKLWLQVVR